MQNVLENIIDVCDTTRIGKKQRRSGNEQLNEEVVRAVIYKQTKEEDGFGRVLWNEKLGPKKGVRVKKRNQMKGEIGRERENNR